jgi:putative transposase
LAAERRRFGYRRLHILLRREGFVVNHKKLFWIYREERLTACLRIEAPQAIRAFVGKVPDVLRH